MRHLNHWRARLVTATTLSVTLVAAVVGLGSTASAAPATTQQAQAPTSAVSTADTIPPASRSQVLPSGWQQSNDRAVTTDGDSTGLHVLVADAKSGYTWRTAATLSEPGMQTSQWIGQSCVTGSGQRAVVVYAPRESSNDENLFEAGGLVAIVDVTTGAVRKLPITASLAYYDPACDSGETAELTENFYRGSDYISRLITVDTTNGTIKASIDALGQVTSAVATPNGVLAAKGPTLVAVARNGTEQVVASPGGDPIRLAVDANGGVGYEVQTASQTELHRYSSGQDSLVTKAPNDSMQLHEVAGQVFVQGRAVTKLPAGWHSVVTDPGAEVSTQGQLAVTSSIDAEDSPNAPAAVSPGSALPVSISTTVLATGKHPAFTVAPSPMQPAQGAAASPAIVGQTEQPTRSNAKAAVDPSTTTIDPNRGCAIARNDPTIQALQPTPQMGEWAADLAVKGALTVARPAGWNGTSLPAYTPQGMFPPHPLIGGGTVPAQVLLGVMAQESNMWQAGSNVVDGESGNFEIGGFYGKNVGVNSVNFANVDCGYGATQVTTGMSVKEGSSVYTPTQQLAIATDYAANIAAGLEILEDKWNQMKQLGMLVNNANPAVIENWWYALWAYNSGWHNQGVDSPTQYGLGWANNMDDEDFPADRDGFLDDGYGDAKYPNHWSYPERVLGWSAHPLLRLDWKGGDYHTAYAPARWGAGDAPQRPGLGLFCTSDNDCDTSKIYHPKNYPTDPGSNCQRDDLECWWHQPASWGGCDVGQCGSESLAYSPGDPEPTLPSSQMLYKPDCSSINQLPANALVIDDVAPSVHTNTTCRKNWADHGTLTWEFGADSSGNYPSKIDFHQLDTGFGGHMWFANTWQDTVANIKHSVTGTWTLDQQINGWARVLVYVPDHAAMDPQAVYEIHNSDSSSPNRSLDEGNYLDDNRNPAAGHWESLGAFNFKGTPSVSLNNLAPLGLNPGWVDDDRAVDWDAVAFQPLPTKPTNQVVALGDSYSSGEGASNAPVNGAWDYYRSSDHDGQTKNGDNAEFQDSCHRSPYAWSRVAYLPDVPTSSIGSRMNTLDPTLDYHMAACSGAVSQNMLPSSVPSGPLGLGQYSEGSQLDQGYLDQNTTLVTLSIGGNDARFTKVIKDCITETSYPDCSNDTLAGDTQPLSVSEPNVINNTVEPAIETILVDIHRQAPNARILLMGYPEIFDQAGNTANKMCSLGITQASAYWLDQMADTLDVAVGVAAINVNRNDNANVTYADPRSSFAGKGVCDTNPAINNIMSAVTRGESPTPLNLGTQQSFHPTVAGAAVYGTVATSTFASMGA
jgi:hypothetical protein